MFSISSTTFALTVGSPPSTELSSWRRVLKWNLWICGQFCSVVCLRTYRSGNMCMDLIARFGYNKTYRKVNSKIWIPAGRRNDFAYPIFTSFVVYAFDILHRISKLLLGRCKCGRFHQSMRPVPGRWLSSQGISALHSIHIQGRSATRTVWDCRRCGAWYCTVCTTHRR